MNFILAKAPYPQFLQILKQFLHILQVAGLIWYKKLRVECLEFRVS
jgi:hypothetical protein